MERMQVDIALAGSTWKRQLLGGEWHFCQQYATTLQIPESVWFTKIKPEARTKHLKKVQSCQLKQISL